MLVRDFNMKVIVNGTSGTFGIDLVTELLAMYTLAKNDLHTITGCLLWIMFVPACPKSL